MEIRSANIYFRQIITIHFSREFFLIALSQTVTCNAKDRLNKHELISPKDTSKSLTFEVEWNNSTKLTRLEVPNKISIYNLIFLWFDFHFNPKSRIMGISHS